MVPCAVFGMWMAITDQPERWINGFDSLPLERRRAVARFFGVSMAAGSIVMSGSIAVMMNGALVAGILIFVASMIIFFYPMRYLASKRPRVPEVSRNHADNDQYIYERNSNVLCHQCHDRG